MSKRGYKRSWKNFLLNRNYQLAFTGVMVVCTAIPMAALGWYVMKQATSATEVAETNLAGVVCQKPPSEEALRRQRVQIDQITEMEERREKSPDTSPSDSRKTPDGEVKTPDGEGKTPDGEVKTPDGEVKTPDGEGKSEATKEAAGERTRSRSAVVVDSEMALIPKAAVGLNKAELATMTERYDACVASKKKSAAQLQAGERLIFRVLVGACVCLLMALVVYGIRLTHKVAGPLHKVSLYLDKLRENKYDTVYDLRKGDHLLEFYDHFKRAHDGLKKMQKEDLENIKAVVDALDEAGLLEQAPELKVAADELRQILKDKEESFV